MFDNSNNIPAQQGSKNKALASAQQQIIDSLLESHIMLGSLSAEDKSFLRNLFEFREFKADSIIAQQGTPVEGLYYLYSGVVRLKQTRGGRRISAGELGKETVLGELSLLKESSWEHQIEVVDDAIVLFLPATEVRASIVERTEMASVFTQQAGLVEVGQRVRGMLGTAEYTQQQFRDICANIGIKRVKAGNTIFKQGQEDPRIYHIEKGAVELLQYSLDNQKDNVVDKVVRGELIGEGGALEELSEQGQQPFTARALTEVTVLVIRQPEVKKIFEINPAIHESLRVRAKALEERALEGHSVRKRAEGVNLNIKLADAITEEEFRAQEGKSTSISKFPIVHQLSESDCAAACLTMIVNYYGKPFTLGQIRELTGLSYSNANPNQIITGAEQLGLASRGYSLQYSELKRLNMPAVIGWEGYHYAVLHKITESQVILADPEKGKIKLSKSEFLEGWTTQEEVNGELGKEESGVVIAMEPTVAFEQKEAPKKPIYHFIKYLLPFKSHFAEAFLAAFTINLLGMASPLFIQTIVDKVVVHHDTSLLNMMLVGMALVAIFKTLSSSAQNLLLAHTTARIDIKLMSEFYKHILSLPMSFFLTRNKGEIMARFGENAKIRAIIAGSTITVILNTLMIVIYFLMMSAYSTDLTLIVLFFVPLYLGIVFYFTPRIKQLSQQIFQTNTQSQSHLIESLNGIEAIKATANEYMARARWENAFVENVNTGFKRQRLSLISTNLNQLVSLGSTVAVLWVGANLVMSGGMTIGELMGFNMLMGMVMGPILQMVGLWNNLQEVRIAVDRVSDVLNVEPEQAVAPDPETLPVVLNGEDVRGRITFTNVNFSYVANDKENYIMRDFDLTIKAGTKVAFVGASGCGKSTIAKMVLGFNMPKSGECKIDGREIRDLDLAALRKNIGVVLQDSFIFAGTVAENIAFGDPNPDMQMVKEAARLAGSDEFIINYPLGYQTLIGEKGMGISGGQRQRICIARALYYQPRIMIFDEATSALDNDAEKRIQENMDKILAGRTSITIAHRLSTIVDSDVICFIKDGQVAEQGTHEELISPEYIQQQGYDGLYYALAEGQFGLPPLKLDDELASEVKVESNEDVGESAVEHAE